MCFVSNSFSTSVEHTFYHIREASSRSLTHILRCWRAFGSAGVCRREGYCNGIAPNNPTRASPLPVSVITPNGVGSLGDYTPIKRVNTHSHESLYHSLQ